MIHGRAVLNDRHNDMNFGLFPPRLPGTSSVFLNISVQINWPETLQPPTGSVRTYGTVKANLEHRLVHLFTMTSCTSIAMIQTPAKLDCVLEIYEKASSETKC